MEKAFDLKALGEELKGAGLPIAEDAVQLVVEKVLLWVEKSVVLSENKYDDFALAIIPAIKPFVMKSLDKIDGKEG